MDPITTPAAMREAATLREQVSAIVAREFSGDFLHAAGFPSAVNYLAAHLLAAVARGELSAQSVDVLATVRCLDLFAAPGYVTEDEPAIRALPAADGGAPVCEGGDACEAQPIVCRAHLDELIDRVRAETGSTDGDPRCVGTVAILEVSDLARLAAGERVVLGADDDQIVVRVMGLPPPANGGEG